MKAWELMGCIMEHQGEGQGLDKGQVNNNDHVETINCYRQCWKLGHESSLTIGSRLALMYLKTKEFSNAIDIATKVLKQYPDSPHMVNVLEKCVLSLRP